MRVFREFRLIRIVIWVVASILVLSLIGCPSFKDKDFSDDDDQSHAVALAKADDDT
ncbi:unnamed protein product, partial [marine sediment metagenome]